MQDADAWNALFWCNHDQPRALSRFGDDKNYPRQSSKMLATCLHCMRGTPYVYQGEEIGMTNAYFTDIAQYRDVESINFYHILKQQGKDEKEIYHILQERSRDNARTPMQWNDSANASFSDSSPWIPLIDNYKQINVQQALADPDSTFYHYQKLIQMRKEMDIIAEGSYHPILEEHAQVFAYERRLANETMYVINNFYGSPCSIQLPKEGNNMKSLISNYSDTQVLEKMTLRPYESFVLYQAK